MSSYIHLQKNPCSCALVPRLRRGRTVGENKKDEGWGSQHGVDTPGDSKALPVKPWLKHSAPPCYWHLDLNGDGSISTEEMAALMRVGVFRFHSLQ